MIGLHHLLYANPLLRGVAKAALHCAHWTSTVPSCAFCEQEGHLATLPHPFKLEYFLPWEWHRSDPTAAVERAHSDRARSGSKGSARVSFHPFHRARSASKKWHLAALRPPSKLARSLFRGWGLIDLPLRATFSPAHPLARRDVPSARARTFWSRALRQHRKPSSLPLLPSKGGLVDPLMRASNEHILIVRVPRAGGRPGCPSPLL